MVTTRFAWPYGGRQVFLGGSFTGWTNHVLMTPVEGSTAVLQAICNLSPGYHQYKFLVDGVWKLDNQQPYETDEYGTVNNVIFIKEPEILRSEASSSESSMEIDNGTFQPPALFSGGTDGEMTLQISEGEIDLSRRCFSTLLSGYTAYELLPESDKVCVLDATVAVKQAFHVMYEQGLAVMPVWDESRGNISGMLTSSDFILILIQLHNNGSMLTDEELESHSISAWKEGKFQLNGISGNSVHLPYGRPLIQAGPNESLKDVALRILQNRISMVPIIHQAHDNSPPQLLHLACLSGILKYISRYYRHSPGSLPILQQPIGRLPLGTWVSEISRADRGLTSLQANASLVSALTLFNEAQVSSIPIVDDGGSLLDVYCRSDITSLAKANAYQRIQLDQTNMHQALQFRYEAHGATYSQRRCQTCLRSESLHAVMERLSDPAVRRLIVIEPGSKRVEGIISLTDIFSFLMS